MHHNQGGLQRQRDPEQEKDVEGFQVIYGREQGAQRTFSNDHVETSNVQVSLHEPTCDPF